MGKKREGHGATDPAVPVDVGLVEEIATCACSHPLSLHVSEGCSVPACDCDQRRELLLLGKVRAVDEL